MIAAAVQNCAVYRCGQPARVRLLCDSCYQLLVVEAHHRAAAMKRERLSRRERMACYAQVALGLMLFALGVWIAVREMGGPRAFFKEVSAAVVEFF